MSVCGRERQRGTCTFGALSSELVAFIHIRREGKNGFGEIKSFLDVLNLSGGQNETSSPH